MENLGIAVVLLLLSGPLRCRVYGGPLVVKRIVVLQSFPKPSTTTNPYITMLWHSLSTIDGLRIKTFSWRDALFGNYDVFHIHWPEILVSGRTPPRRLVRQTMFVFLMLRLTITRTPVVRTVHNVALPKDIGPFQHLLLGWLDSKTSHRILLNSSTELPAGQSSTLVLHGHYRDWFSHYEILNSVSGRITYFGLIRRYKRVDNLIQAFRQTESSAQELSLHIVGRPSSDELKKQIHQLADGDQRIVVDLEFQSDEELAVEVSQSELVVLPYEEMHNSGGVLTALSFGRPVLVPDNTVNRKLAAEVGPGWVHTFSGDLTGDAIVATLRNIRAVHVAVAPNLDARNWGSAGIDHLAAYDSLLAGNSN